jgi:excisionase family DNA binding protein
MSGPVDRSNDPSRKAQPRKLLTSAEVAERFSVHTNTVARWHGANKLQAIRTLGGHRRFYEDEVEKLTDPNHG